MKNFIVAMFICIGLFLSIDAFAKEAIQAVDKQNQINYLFVQVAHQGILKEIAAMPGTYQLTLYGVNSNVEYFSDRPERVSGMMSIADFLKDWDRAFNQSSPNVAVSGMKNILTKKSINIAMELSSPTYDEAKKTMTYQAKILDGEVSPTKEIKFKGIALFFDDYCASCVGNGF